MSTKTLHYCDKCNSEVETSKEMTDVEIKISPYDTYRNRDNKWEKVDQYYCLCETCTEKLGFIKKTIVEDKPVVTLTTADKLYDIIAQMIEEAKQ